MASQETKVFYNGAYSVQFKLMEHERLRKMHDERHKSIRSAREKAHLLSKETMIRKKALEEKKLAMARAEEERRRKALEERHMKQQEATNKFRNATYRFKTATKSHYFNDTILLDAKLVKPVAREDDRKQQQDKIVLGQDVEVTRLSHHIPNLDDVLDNIRGKVVQSVRSISGNTYDVIKTSKDVLPLSLIESKPPITIGLPGSITPTNGKILYPVPSCNSHQSVLIHPSSDPLEELSSNNSSPHDSLESLSPPPSPDEKETPTKLPVQAVKKPVLSAQPVTKPPQPVAKPVLPAQPIIIIPVVSAQPVTKPVVPPQPIAKPVLPSQPVVKPVVPAQPVAKPVLSAQAIAKPVLPTKPFLQVQPVAKLVQPVLPVQQLEITTKTTEPLSPQEITPTKEEKKVVGILKKTSDSPCKHIEGIDNSISNTISSCTLLSGLSLATSKLSSAKRVRFVDDLQMEAETAINGFSEEVSLSTDCSTPKMKISLLNSQGINISSNVDEPDTTKKTTLNKTPTDDDIDALWSQINGYLHYHKHSNGTDAKVNSTPQLTRRCYNAHQPIKLWRRQGLTHYIGVDQYNGQKPSITIMENRLLESIEALNEKLKGRVITVDTYNPISHSPESTNKKSQNRSLTELPRTRVRHHPKTIIQTTPTPKQHLTNR